MAELNRGPLVSASMVLGIGMGGFLDGIVAHEILQVHSMLSAKVTRSTVVGLETNMFWDGLFHAFCWIATSLGIAMLWRAVRRADVPLSTRTLIGGMLLGWGLFNLTEGVINHHVLHIHHVVELVSHRTYDFAFLAFGAGLVILGWSLIRSGSTGGRSGVFPWMLAEDSGNPRGVDAGGKMSSDVMSTALAPGQALP